MSLSAEQERLVSQAESGKKLPAIKRGALRALELGLVGDLNSDELERVAAAAHKQEGAA